MHVALLWPLPATLVEACHRMLLQVPGQFAHRHQVGTDQIDCRCRACLSSPGLQRFHPASEDKYSSVLLSFQSHLRKASLDYGHGFRNCGFNVFIGRFLIRWGLGNTKNHSKLHIIQSHRELLLSLPAARPCLSQPAE